MGALSIMYISGWQHGCHCSRELGVPLHGAATVLAAAALCLGIQLFFCQHHAHGWQHECHCSCELGVPLHGAATALAEQLRSASASSSFLPACQFLDVMGSVFSEVTAQYILQK